MNELLHKELSSKIIKCFYIVYNSLGFGFLEKVYENALMMLFRNEQIQAEQQSSIKVFFQNKVVGNYIADILVEDKIILELKTVIKITDIHKAQALNYLKATGLHLAIIFNFHSQSLEYERIVL